jgi:hypothetical protein
MKLTYSELFNGYNAVINNSEVQDNLISAGFRYRINEHDVDYFYSEINRKYIWRISIYKNYINLQSDGLYGDKKCNKNFAYNYDVFDSFQEQLLSVISYINRNDPTKIILSFESDYNPVERVVSLPENFSIVAV